MVNLSNNIISSALQNKTSLQAVSVSEIEAIIAKYPAFHTAHLMKAYILNKEDNDIFKQELPIIATQVKDRATLHDYIYTEHYFEKPEETKIASKEKFEKEKISSSKIKIEQLDNNVEEIIEKKPVLTKEKIIVETPIEITKLKNSLKQETQEVKNKTEKTEQQQFSKQTNKTDISENNSEKTTENIPINNVDIEKEFRRKEAMRKLQDELFETKMANTSVDSTKDAKRIDAMKKLQEELFKTETAKTIKEKESLKATKPEQKNTEHLVNEEKNEPQKIVTDNIEIAPTEETPILSKLIEKEEKNLEKKKEQQKIEENLEKEVAPVKKEIEKLIKEQEEIVQKFISEENQFEEKEEKLDFIDWLKLKNTPSLSDEIKLEKQVIEPEKNNDKEEIERIPIDPSGMIEAEMHQEMKASADPLDSFISSQITRKKRKKKRNKIQNDTKTDTKKRTIVSETLAEIFVVQQKYNEAIDVYSLLGLKYPQKSIYFARQIEKIKKYI